MSMKESLSGISTELGKILQQLRDIESVQGRLSKSAGSYASALSGAGGGGVSSTGGSGFSTPPPAPGSQAAGVMGTSAAGGAAAPQGGGGGGAGGAAAAALGAIVTAGYNFMPSQTDSIAYQSAFFRSSFMGQGGYKEDDLAKMRAMFGNRQTDPFGMVTAANAATMSGMGIGTSHFSTVMRQTATTSLLFGQSNATAAQAQTSLYSGPTAGRLGNIGIFVSSLDTGDPRAFGDIVDQIWGRAYGSPNAKVPYESVMADLRGGYLGAWLRRNFSDNPALYDQIYQALVLKANSNGRSLDYSDLTGKNGINRVTGSTGTASAMGAGGSLGLNENNDPMYFAARGYGAQARAIEGAMDEMVGAWTASMDKLITATENYANAMAEGNRLLESMAWLKSLGQTLGSNPVFAPLVGGALGLITGGVVGAGVGMLGGLLGGKATGGLGTSTSDSITARLSKGEYVINARAAQQIGKDNLDAMNSMGHAFGSGYASPAKAFAGGGQVGESELGYTQPTVLGTIPSPRGGTLTAGQATLDRWSTLLPGDPALKSYSISGSSLNLTLLERDGIGQYLADFAAAWQSDPKLGGGRLTLNKSGASGGYDARTTGHSGNGVSNHAAGVAMDLRWDIISAHDGDTWQTTDSENAAIRALLQKFSKLEWGGEWSGGMLDEMHFEIRDPGTWGKGGHTGPDTTKIDETPDPVTKTSEAGGGIQAASALLSGAAGPPGKFSMGGFTGGAKGLSLGLGSRFSWVAGNLFGTNARGGIGAPNSKTTKNAEETTGKSDAMAEPTGNVGSGSGPEWLYKYLVSKGLRGNTLHTAWVIGMRESGGNPKSQSKDRYGGSWTSSGSPHYDVGLYQINNRHLSTVQKRYGGDMRQMLDLEKNYDMTTYMSNNWSNLLAWALESDGQTFNWSMYNPVPSWAGASMANHRRLWGEYDKYNTQNYSEGAYRTHEGMAKIHEGEMVLPANVAERFREMMREMGGPRGGRQGNINITLKIEKASDAEAERFARKVKKLLEEDSWESAMRTR